MLYQGFVGCGGKSRAARINTFPMSLVEDELCGPDEVNASSSPQPTRTNIFRGKILQGLTEHDKNSRLDANLLKLRASEKMGKFSLRFLDSPFRDRIVSESVSVEMRICRELFSTRLCTQASRTFWHLRAAGSSLAPTRVSVIRALRAKVLCFAEAPSRPKAAKRFFVRLKLS